MVFRTILAAVIPVLILAADASANGRKRLSGDDSPPRPPLAERLEAAERRPLFSLEQDAWLERMTGEPFTFNNRVRFLIDGPEFYPVRREMIAGARRTIDLQTYLWCDDEAGTTIANDLAAAARRGVRVRVIIDYFNVKEHFAAYRTMREAGVEILVFNPPYWGLSGINDRIHEKVMIVDGHEALVGGANLCDEYMLEDAARTLWHDLEVQIEGPVIERVQRRWDETWNWMAEKDSVRGRDDDNQGGYRNRYLDDPMRPRRRPPRGASRDYTRYPDTEVNAEPAGGAMAHLQLQQPYIHDVHSGNFLAVYGYLFQQARERVVFYAPYLIPPYTFERTIIEAARRGVDVTIITNSPETNDMGQTQVSASLVHYGRLIEAGVQIYESQVRTLHAKAMLFDEKLLIVGSHNFTHRSFSTNGEASIMTDDAGAIGAFQQMMAHDMDELELVTKEEFESRTDDFGEAWDIIFGRWFEKFF